jgi:hypothetical protein
VSDLDDPQQVLHGRAQPGEMLSGARDAVRVAPANFHGSQIFRSKLVVLPQVPPEVCGIGMQLLVPLHMRPVSYLA